MRMFSQISPLALFLAALGLWFLMEGLAYAVAPDAMKRFLDWAARLGVPEIRSAGLWTAAMGAIFLYVALRLI
ncbi:MAG: DUF2065 domain-containing protein [Hyphomonadaceae bacterium]|nr:DUF2065 domain-containing protein [Hyphomonadaceae bacterium]